MQRVDGIEPYNGWVLMWEEYFETERYNSDWYEAHHPEHGTLLLQVTGRGFIPTQARFEFLVRQRGLQNRVPFKYGYQGMIGVPWNNQSIDRAIEEERQCPDSAK